jgi:hypothetical protein
MRFSSAVLGIFSIGLLANFGMARFEAERSQQQAYTVSLDIRCPANGAVTTTVNPWRAQVAQGQDIEWTLQGQAQSDSFAIQPKRSGAQNWPYTNPGRRKGTKADRAGYGNMRAGQQGRRFRYNITLWCVRGERIDTVVIDPDVVVGDD